MFKGRPGCKHCYAETFAERWRGIPGHPYEQGFDLKLWGLTAYRDPSEYGNDLGEEYPASTYGNSLI